MTYLNAAFVIVFCFLLTMPLTKGVYSEFVILKILQFSLFPISIMIVIFDMKNFFIEIGPYAYLAEKIIIANKGLILPTLIFGTIIRVYIEISQRWRT